MQPEGLGVQAGDAGVHWQGPGRRGAGAHGRSLRGAGMECTGANNVISISTFAELGPGWWAACQWAGGLSGWCGLIMWVAWVPDPGAAA
jgi:hypothetical protein